MKIPALLAAALLATALPAFAADEYNDVPSTGQPQFRQCLNYAAKLYTGGDDRSPIRGQTKSQAWCTCLYNETPEDFQGNLVTFSESPRGAKTNRVCEKYANWGD